MKKINLLTFALLLSTALSFAQVQKTNLLKVGGSTTPINSSAALDVESTNKGLLLPRVASPAVITNPVNGLIIYDMSNNCIRAYENGAWSICLNGNGVLNGTSNGTAVVSAYACNTASAGTLTAGTPVSGVTQTITATVTTVGTYSITATANGVTFSGAGTFAGTGAQNIVLTATGTPTAAGTFSYALSTTPGCSFDRVAGAGVRTVTSTTGKIWMDRNLGATQVATSATDHLAYGDLYQWGRKADGHEKITWTNATTGTPVNGTTSTNADVPANPLFITENSSPFDWRVNQDNNLWNGVAAVNNPCPVEFRLPTSAELTAEVTAYSITNSATAFSSPFKFTVAGYRDDGTGALGLTGDSGWYWTSSVSGVFATNRTFYSFTTSVIDNYRSAGFSVRCLKN